MDSTITLHISPHVDSSRAMAVADHLSPTPTLSNEEAVSSDTPSFDHQQRDEQSADEASGNARHQAMMQLLQYDATRDRLEFQEVTLLFGCEWHLRLHVHVHVGHARPLYAICSRDAVSEGVGNQFVTSGQCCGCVTSSEGSSICWQLQWRPSFATPLVATVVCDSLAGHTGQPPVLGVL